MPKVSIIIPVYNVEKFLPRCLNSLTNQTLKDIEIICINDGSTDNSPKILEEYKNKDNRVVVINQENSGVSASRNSGMKIAKGEYIGFVDSDDWVDLDFFEKLYNSAIKNGADIAVGGIIRTKPNKRTTLLEFPKEEIMEDIYRKIELADIFEHCYVCGKIYKTEKIKSLNILFEEGRIYEDMIWLPQILYSLTKMVAVPNTYYYYWRHANSLVRIQNSKTKEDFNYAKEKFEKFFKDKNIDVEKYCVKTKRYKIFGLTILKIKQKGDKKEYFFLNVIHWKK